MTLSFTADELASGRKTWRVGDKRRGELKDAVLLCEPIRLKPMLLERRFIRLVIPNAFEPAPDGMWELTFLPLWCRAYVGCHIRSADIRVLVIETQTEKLSFDSSGYSACSFRTSGAGVGRDAEEEAEALLPRLFGMTPKPAILAQVQMWMREARK
jgi:hypothetical protein